MPKNKPKDKETIYVIIDADWDPEDEAQFEGTYSEIQIEYGRVMTREGEFGGWKMVSKKRWNEMKKGG